MIEKKTQEFEEYGQQISALAKQYTTPDPDRLMQARQQGNISLQLGAGDGFTNRLLLIDGNPVCQTRRSSLTLIALLGKYPSSFRSETLYRSAVLPTR